MKMILFLVFLFLTNIFATETEKMCPSFEDMTKHSGYSIEEIEKYERELIYNSTKNLNIYNSYLWLLKTMKKEAKLNDDLMLYINIKHFESMQTKGTLKDFNIIFNNIDLLRAKKETLEDKKFNEKVEFYSESMSQRLQLIRFNEPNWCNKNLLKK